MMDDIFRIFKPVEMFLDEAYEKGWLLYFLLGLGAIVLWFIFFN